MRIMGILITAASPIVFDNNFSYNDYSNSSRIVILQWRENKKQDKDFYSCFISRCIKWIYQNKYQSILLE